MLASLAFAWPTWAIGLLTLLFVLISVVLVLTVLIQKPQGGGLSGAFGSGAGSGQTAFGTKTGDALTVATIIVFAIYLVLGVVLVFAYRPQAATLRPAADKETAPAGEAAPAEGGKVEGQGGSQPAPAGEKPGEAPAATNPPAVTPVTSTPATAPGEVPQRTPPEPAPK